MPDLLPDVRDRERREDPRGTHARQPGISRGGRFRAVSVWSTGGNLTAANGLTIITGCPKSGTATCARLFSFAHEVQFDITWVHSGGNCDVTQSESSWLAAPFAAALTAQRVTVLQLVRHPLKVAASLESIDFWCRANNGYTEFARQYVDVPADLPPILQSIRFWLLWNAMLDVLNVPRIRIESIAGAPIVGKTSEVAPDAKPRRQLTWDDVPDSELKTEAVARTELYGYPA